MGGAFLRVVGIFVAALVGGVVGMFVVLPLGLIVSEYVIFVLALVVSAILAALGGGWATNGLMGDGTRTRLLQLVGMTELAAVAVAVILLGVSAFRETMLGSVLNVALICSVLLAVAATVGALRLRSRVRNDRDGLITFGLIALAVVLVPVVIFVAWLLGLAGA
jgi:hypothetical protein